LLNFSSSGNEREKSTGKDGRERKTERKKERKKKKRKKKKRKKKKGND